MKQKVISTMLLLSMGATLLAGCGTTAGNGTEGGASNAAEGKVINIYSWNDEFRTRVEAVYPEVKETSKDGTITYLKDGTEIHWVVNPNQDGVYQQKLDEALSNRQMQQQMTRLISSYQRQIMYSNIQIKMQT